MKKNLPNTNKFKVGDIVVALDNYLDEQLCEFAPASSQIVVAVKNVKKPGTTGQWIKTDHSKEWVDAGWFNLVWNHRRIK